MNISLKTFQEARVHELRETTAIALRNWIEYGKKQIISFTAPTGAGKTIMMADFIESILCGGKDNLLGTLSDSIFIWLSDAPELNEQSKQKLMKYCDKMVLSQFVTLDESFRGEMLEQGKVYFLNTQKLTRTSRMTQTGDERDWTIWQVLQNTIEEYGQKLFLVIDEAHRGAKTSQTTTMQKFVKGFESEEDGRMEALPFIIGMSATPERFNALAGASLSYLSKVVVTPKEVRNSGLLKDRIELHFPEESVINKNIAVLQAAADEWKDKCVHWKSYTEQQQEEAVNPIFVVQVEPGTSSKPSATDLNECLQEIEKRTGASFETGEVVHSFGETGTLTINGIEIPYCPPSAINDDTKIKVVLFKEALSTGWDCPRAEAMMSYRVAKDATYIAQLLGRMIRTPKRRHIQSDESLNYVHLYLPNFDESTVEEVVKRLTEEEGGVLPTEVKAVQGGKKQVVRMTVRRPTTYTHPQAEQRTDSPSEPFTPSQQPVETHTQPQAHTPTESTSPELKMITEKWVEPNPKQPDPYEEVKEALNKAGIITYHFEPSVKKRNQLRSLFDLAQLGIMTGMDETFTAVDKVKDDIVSLIHNYAEGLRKSGEYASKVDEALELKLNTISFEFYKSNSTYDSHQGPNLYSKTDAGLQYQFDQAETLLCGEGIAQRYLNTYEEETDETTCMYDVIFYAADEHQRDLLMKYASDEFDRLVDLYRPKSNDLPEKSRNKYNDLAALNRKVSQLLYKIQDEVEFVADETGETYTDHLFVNAEGKATFHLKGWEPDTLKEERKNPNFVCWLRNQERGDGALCISYEYGKETIPMYPDFLIVRKKENGGYSFGLLEPHMDGAKDNLAKAQGLVKYAQMCHVFDRIQMLRKKGKRMLRLELTDRAVQKRVMACGDDIGAFDNVFTELGFFE